MNKIQNAMYEDKDVRAQMLQLHSGEDAIAFFAKYGNTTPIKFIHCVKNCQGPFSPYKLSIVHNQNELAKVNEYYTVSPSGIVLIYSSSLVNKKDKFMSKTPSEFINLSDWMRESTLFNILSNIDFFKNYLSTKILRTWRKNIKKAVFQKTRQKIRRNVFYCKPQFASSLLAIRVLLTRAQTFELVNFSQYQQRQVEFEEFKSMQKEVRNKIGKEFESIFEAIIGVISKLICDITVSRDKNQVVVEESTLELKHKPLNLIRREKEERAMRKNLTEVDFRMIGSFIRLVNYLAIEVLAEINMNSVFKVEEEMYRERKNGLFTTSPVIDDRSIVFMNRENDIVNTIDSIFEQNIKLCVDLPKIIENVAFEVYVRELQAIGESNVSLIKPNIQNIVVNSTAFKLARERIVSKIFFDFGECRKKIDVNYLQCKRIDAEKSRFNVEQWIESEPTLDEVKSKLIVMKDFKKESGDKIKEYFYGILHVDPKIMRNILTNFITESLNKIKDYLYHLMTEKVSETNKRLEVLVAYLNKSFESLQDYCEYIRDIKEVRESLDVIDANKVIVDQMHKQLKQVNMAFTIEDKTNFEQIVKMRERINEELPRADELIKLKKEEYVEKLKEQTDYVMSKTGELFAQIEIEDLRRTSIPINEALKRISVCKDRLDKLVSRHSKMKEYIGLMDCQLANFQPELPLITNILQRKKNTWDNYDEFSKAYDEWFECNIKHIDIERTEREVRTMELFCQQVKADTRDQIDQMTTCNFAYLIRGPDRKDTLATVTIDTENNDEVIESLMAKVENMKELMPILAALGNKHLRDKHWAQILESIDNGSTLLGKQYISFQDIICLNARNQFKVIQDVSSRATGESTIEQDLAKIRTEWTDISFTLVFYRDYKDKFVLSKVPELFEKLEDHLLKIQSMLASKYSVEVRESLQVWEKKLTLIQDTLEEWMTFQQQWMYFDNIFSAEDIQKQLPDEYVKLSAINKFWKEIMLKVQKKPSVLDNISSSDLMIRFSESNMQLELIQSMLDDYLEVKRRIFPRFYFLSNDELLEIFSQIRNSEAIQPHLPKCFDNIKSLEFDMSKTDNEMIVAMSSADPENDREVVYFDSSIALKGSVENWLKNVENAMQSTLRSKLNQFKIEMETQSTMIDFNHMTRFPAQISLVLNMIRWTSFTEYFMTENSIGEMSALINEQIEKSVEMMKRDISVGLRETIKNLIISDVHNRDVVNFLEKTNSSINDFNWSRQFKYVWDSAGSDRTSVQKLSSNSLGEIIGDCLISQNNNCIHYGYEYIGNSSRLVITPLTDKCYLTLTTALSFCYGGAPSGPAGTGKTETVKDLAKAVANICIVFNCSDSLNHTTMSRFFSGLAQCGAWACFDEFNRINVEVLSVVSQQIMTIQNAVKERRFTFDFDGKIIQLNNKFGVFITMNPASHGYSNRSDLPDNLKSLFRPVAMMIPDYALIAEIMLFSEGFQKAKEFSQKLVHLFQIAAAQLSKQKHYDFGMRAVKAVLNMAGKSRKKDTHADEYDIIIKAIRESNLPKFLTNDMALFENIIHDLFPEKGKTVKDDSTLIDQCRLYLTHLNLQLSDNQIKKAVQLNEVTKVRHGVMSLGTAGTGKTTTLNMLVDAAERLNQKIEVVKLNPKALTLNELFGFNEVYTNCFTHGIVSKIVTHAIEDTSETRKWVLFDGPVDSEWVENLNTALDDNKILCLPDGKRIKLPNSFSMIFELDNLNSASPATVSRCGIVFFDQFTINPLDAFHKFKLDYRKKLHNQIDADSRLKYFHDLFTDPTFIDTLTELLNSAFSSFKLNHSQSMPNVDYNLVYCGLRLFEFEMSKFIVSFLNKAKDIKIQSRLDKYFQSVELREILFSIFGFSLVWSIGANLTEFAKSEINKKFKMTLFKRTGSFLANFNSVFDFFIDYDNLVAVSWKNNSKAFIFEPKLAFHKLIVDTVETISMRYFLETLCLNDVPLLVSGPVGVGKSLIIKSFLDSLPDTYISAQSCFSSQTVSKHLEVIFNGKLAHKGKDLAPNAGKTLILFIDDINMPTPDSHGTQSVNELVRQITDQGGFYDVKKYVFRHVHNVVFLAACTNLSNERNVVSQRLTRHFHSLSVPEISEESCQTIFSSILGDFLRVSQANESVLTVVNALTKSTFKLYKGILNTLLPTPSKCHYVFTTRDLSRVIQGLLQADISNIDCELKLIQLWNHEMSRVFSDRLIDKSEKNWFGEKLVSACRVMTKNPIDNFDGLCFTSIITGKYQLVTPSDDLPLLISETAKNYAIIAGKDAGLVFFADLIKQVCNVQRTLSFASCNALLLGINGCGKRSVANLAIFINKNHACKIDTSVNYRTQDWHEDMKKMMKLAVKDPSLEGKSGVTLLVSDNQLTHIDDINNILSTGEIPNLFSKNEIEELKNELSQQAQFRKNSDSISTAEFWDLFLQGVRRNFHLILTFSPLGNHFRSHCRNFPSLVNCCSVIYFSKWPSDVLVSIAESELRRSNLNLSTGVVRQVATILSEVNETTEKKMHEYFSATRRKCYMTPSGFIDMIKLYVKLVKEKQHAIPLRIKKYEVGLQRLTETKNEVEELQKRILAFQPQLEHARNENKAILLDLGDKNSIATEKEQCCQKEAHDILKTQIEVEEMRKQCQQELNMALPALIAAQNAAKSIDKVYMASVKTYIVVAKDIEMVLLAMNALFGKKETWDEVKKTLSDIDLVKKLQNLDPMTVPLKTWSRLRQNYLSRPEFNPVTLKEKISEAISTLANYLINMEVYYFKKKDIEPKEQKLASAESKLTLIEAEMKTKMNELAETKAIVKSLRSKLDTSIEKEKSLEDEQDRAKLHLERAQKLLEGLADESRKWQEFALSLKEDEKNLLGDILLTAACTSFSGPFNQHFRDNLLEEWSESVAKEAVQVSAKFSLINTLGDQVKILDWNLKGLPADEFSIDNALIVMNSVKFPLLIDPQMQMNKWIKSVFKDNSILVIKNKSQSVLKHIENAVRFGSVVVIEDVQESLDCSLDAVLLRQTIKRGTVNFLKINDQEIPYNSDFRLFITTKLHNPHYLPDTVIKVNLVNCTVTEFGLKNQLLSEIVNIECPDLESQRNDLIRQISVDRRQLIDIQVRILKLINESQTNLLEDEELINTFEVSKNTSQAINTRMKDAEVTNDKINLAREVYAPLAIHGSMLYFIVAGLNSVNSMYQFSLEHFINFFVQKIRSNKQFDYDAGKRVAFLMNDIAFSLSKTVSACLFDAHKLFFNFILAIRTQIISGDATNEQWRFFTDTQLNSIEKTIGEAPVIFGQERWRKLSSLSTISESAKSLKQLWKTQEKKLEAIVCRDDLTESDFRFLCEQFKCSFFEAVLVLQILRGEKIEQITQIYITKVLGPQYLDYQPFDITSLMQEATESRPVIIILSPGANPLTSIFEASTNMQKGNSLRVASLGQGQSDKANELIKKSRLSGDWVLLQNCHLAVTWLNQFEDQISESVDEVSSNHRLILTTMPIHDFPIPILEKAIKVACEPPKGIRANLKHTYLQLDADAYNESNQNTYKQLFFCLTMFHAVAFGRRKFGSIGWNVSYNWMNSDLECSQKHLGVYAQNNDEVPFETLLFLIGSINYGGRITDSNDERLVSALLRNFINKDVFNNNHVFTHDDSFEYKIPDTSNLQSIVTYIDKLPLIDQPAIFGLNHNATINLDLHTASAFKQCLQSFELTNRHDTSPNESENELTRLINDMLERVGKPIKVDNDNFNQPLVVFRNQEIERLNMLVTKMKSSLSELIDALKGNIVMSVELEEMAISMHRQQLPDTWTGMSYLSLKPLSSWFDDLIKRIEFFSEWMLLKQLNSYWISAFFFPQGFLTAVTQSFSRDRNVPIDTVSLQINVLSEKYEMNDLVTTCPEVGCNIHGLYLENAHYDVNDKTISDSLAKVVIESMPIVWLQPVVCTSKPDDNANVYQCPVYKTSARSGELSTTGHSTNFIDYFAFGFRKGSIDFWTRRGVAIVLQSSN